MSSIKNTHYNLIDTLIFAMGKDKFATLYSGWSGPDMNVMQYSEKYSIPMPVASVLIDCFTFAHLNDWKPWTR